MARCTMLSVSDRAGVGRSALADGQIRKSTCPTCPLHCSSERTTRHCEREKCSGGVRSSHGFLFVRYYPHLSFGRYARMLCVRRADERARTVTLDSQGKGLSALL